MKMRFDKIINIFNNNDENYKLCPHITLEKSYILDGNLTGDVDIPLDIKCNICKKTHYIAMNSWM